FSTFQKQNPKTPENSQTKPNKPLKRFKLPKSTNQKINQTHAKATNQNPKHDSKYESYPQNRSHRNMDLQDKPEDDKREGLLGKVENVSKGKGPFQTARLPQKHHCQTRPSNPTIHKCDHQEKRTLNTRDEMHPFVAASPNS
ncbi:MAG: hypothetical protein ACJAVO_002384, partial [Parvibaculaceae bacterium]